MEDVRPHVHARIHTLDHTHTHTHTHTRARARANTHSATHTITCNSAEGEVSCLEVEAAHVGPLDEQRDLDTVQDDGQQRREESRRLEGFGHEQQ